MIQLKFHPRHMGEIEEKDKRLTARIDWNAEMKFLEDLEFINAQTSDVFGTGTLTNFYTMSLMQFIQKDWEYHRSYRDFAEFERAFGEYYPDIDLGKVEYITIIEWGDTFESV